MASTGIQYAQTGSVVARTSATTWTNPGNISSDNAADATCSNNTGAGSYYLVCSNFGFSVPSTATVRGITVTVQASEHTAGTEVLSAQLQDETGTLVGGTKSATISGTTKANYNYGSTSDLWSATLTPTVVNNSTFGVRLWFSTSHDVRIDFVRMTVEYSETVTLLEPSTVTVSGYAPVLTYGTEYVPGVGGVTAHGYDPSVVATVQDVRVSFARLDTRSTAGIELPASTGQLTAEGYAPSLAVTLNAFLVPGVGEATAEGFAPSLTVTENQFITAGVGELAAAGADPTVARTASYDITTAIGSVSVQGYPPVLNTTTVNVCVSWATFDTLLPQTEITFGRAFTNFLTFSPATSRTDNHDITVGIGAVIAEGFAPGFTEQGRVTTGLAEVTAEGYAPSVVRSIICTPDVGGVTVEGYAPTAYHGAVDVRVSWATFDPIADSRPIGAAQLQFVGYPPAIGAIVIGGAGHRDLSWTASTDPGVTGYYVYWDTASRGNDNYQDYANSADVPGIGIEDYTVTGLEIGRLYYFNISSHGAGGHDAYESELYGEFAAEALDTGLVIYGYAPTTARTTNVLRLPGVASVTAEGYAVALNITSNVPGTAEVAAEGFAPTIDRTANQWIDLGVGALSAQSAVMDAAQATIGNPNPGVASITMVGYAPDVAGDLALVPGAGEVSAEGFAPTLALSDFLILFPGTGEVTADGPAPTVVRSDFHWVTSDAPQDWRFDGFAPVLLESGAFSIGTGLAAVTINGFTPYVEKGERKKGGRKRRQVVERREEEETVAVIEAQPIRKARKVSTEKVVSLVAPTTPQPTAPNTPPAPPEQPSGLTAADYMVMAQAAQAEAEQQMEHELALIFSAIQEERQKKRKRLAELIRKAQTIIEMDGQNDPELWYMKRR